MRVLHLGLHFRRPRRGASALLGAAVIVSGVLTTPSPASAASPSRPTAQHSVDGRRPVVPGSNYLALGDSVAFGYREPTTFPPPDYQDPKSFRGYPEEIGSALGLRVANATCPGETSGSLISTSNPSYACETPAGYRTNFPLHVKYRSSTESQLRFAIHYLARHPNTRLVTLGIGANDGFLCAANNGGTCTGPALAATLKAIRQNVRTILSALRDEAGYRGQIVIVYYYSLDYGSPTANASSQGLNQAMTSAARPFHVRVADEYATFENAALHSGGDSCAAGLLTQLFPDQTSTESGAQAGCGVHPSAAGQDVLAHTIEAKITK